MNKLQMLHTLLYVYPHFFNGYLVYFCEVLMDVKLGHLHGTVKRDHIRRLGLTGTDAGNIKVGQEDTQLRIAFLE